MPRLPALVPGTASPWISTSFPRRAETRTVEPMNIFLTGSTGRVGSRLLPRLLGSGNAVTALVRSPDAAERVRVLGAQAVIGDLIDPASYADVVEGHDAVLHVGAVLRSDDDSLIRRVNLDSTLHLAQAAVAAGVRRFVFTSTNLVYPAGLGRPATEADEPAPDAVWGAYPQAKVEAERALLGMDELGVRVVRLAFVYGEGDPHLAESLRWAAQWPAHQRLQLIHHADVAQALLRALNAPGVDGRIFNASDDAPLTAYELHQVNGRSMPGNEATDGDMWHGIVDTWRIRSELGFRPIYPSVWSARAAGAL
jgi:nucleoside-diphosphate-sugar epimerase